jgi:Na+-driven multidrug efflux pump
VTAGAHGRVRRLALPAIGISLLQTAVLVVDRAMLGHHAETSLAAMQVAGILEWSLWSIFSAFEVATIARVGWHVGGKNRAGARLVTLLSLAAWC